MTSCIRSYRRRNRNRNCETLCSSATGSADHGLATTNCESEFYVRRCHSKRRRNRRFRHYRSKRFQHRCHPSHCHSHCRNRSKERGKSLLELVRRSCEEHRSCRYKELFHKLDEKRKPFSFRKLDGIRYAELGKSEFRIPIGSCSKELAWCKSGIPNESRKLGFPFGKVRRSFGKPCKELVRKLVRNASGCK